MGNNASAVHYQMDNYAVLIDEMMTDMAAATLTLNTSSTLLTMFSQYVQPSIQNDNYSKLGEARALQPALQCYYNFMIQQNTNKTKYDNIVGLNTYVVLKNELEKRWVWLLGEFHTKEHLCDASTSGRNINIVNLLTEHYKNTYYYLDVFYEHGYAIETMPIQSFMFDESKTREPCTNKSLNTQTCPSNVQFHWVDIRDKYMLKNEKEYDEIKYKKWSPLVLHIKEQQHQRNEGKTLVDLLADYLVQLYHGEKSQFRTFNVDDNDVHQMINVATKALFECNTVYFYVQLLTNSIQQEFNDMDDNAKQDSIHTYAVLTSPLQDVYTYYRMVKQYTSMMNRIQNTRNCIFYGGSAHVHSLTELFKNKGYEIVEQKKALFPQYMCLSTETLTQPLLHRIVPNQK